MRIISTDNFIETYAKLVQRGFGFLDSKFRIKSSSRTLSAFDKSVENAGAHKYEFGNDQYDAILFHASLHHFINETDEPERILNDLIRIEDEYLEGSES